MQLMKILRGELDQPWVSIWYYKLDSIDEVGKPEMWLKANPNLGKTVSYETYQRDVDNIEKSPHERNDTLAKRFGLPMEGQTYFFSYEEIQVHEGHHDFWKMPCALGGDLSQGDDFCAFTFLFPLSDGSFGVKTRNYISQLTFDKLPAAMHSTYEEFIREGSLVVMDCTVLDMMQVYDDLDAHITEMESAALKSITPASRRIPIPMNLPNAMVLPSLFPACMSASRIARSSASLGAPRSAMPTPISWATRFMWLTV